MTTWFAQNSSVNIDSVNQWNSAANGSGSWLTWASLGASDILVANGKTSITINVNTTCAKLTTAATGGTAGGGFILSSGITLTAAVEGGSTTCVTLSSGSATIVGNITTSVFAGAVLVSSTGTLTVTGNVTGGSGNAVGITNSSTGTVNVTGNVTGGVTANTFGITNSSTGTVNVTGNVTGGNTFQTQGVFNALTGAVTITGNCYAGSGAGGHAASNNVSTGGSITVVGDVYPSTATNALTNLVSSGVSLGRITVFGNIFSASTGYAGVGNGLLTISPTVEISHAYRTQTGVGIGASRTLYTGGTNIGQPTTANVRSGTTFGASSEYTGTLAVPSPTLVAIGVPTDNTVGSYAPAGGLDEGDLHDALDSYANKADWKATGFATPSDLPADFETLVITDGNVNAVLDSSSVTAVQSGLATSSALTTVGSNVTAILEDTGTTIPSQISGLNNLSSAQVAAVLGTGTWATAIPWNSSWDAEVQSEVQDAIEANNLDHLVKNAVDTNFLTTVHLDSVIGHMADNGTSATFSRTTDSLEAIRDNQASGGGASLEDIISGVQSVSGAIVEAQNSATLSIRIGDTWTQDIDSLGDLTGKTVSFAMKKRASDADTAAIVFITEGTGLTRLNGAATTAGWGSITINDEVAGDITLRLESDATSLLTSGSYVDAVKLLEDGDDRSPRNAGRTVVSAGVIADIT